MNKAIILTESKGGKYLHMVGSLTEGKLKSTNTIIDGKDFTPFGFTKYVKANGFGYTNQQNMGKSKEEVRIKTFTHLMLCFDKIVEDFDLTYILVEIIEDIDNGTYWRLTANYQLLIKK